MLSRFLGHLAADIAKRPARDRARYQTAFSPSWISRLRVVHLERRSLAVRMAAVVALERLRLLAGLWIGLKLQA